ncbi:MAG: response regulator [Desulfobacterales bacterium]|jgi:DNA-binding response OmpR family regulator
MEKQTPYRILIFDDSKEIRSLLHDLFSKRGYEVFSFPNPAACPISHEELCPCPTGEACSDFILSDLNMPVLQGIDFLERQIHKGCQCKNMILMSGDFTENDVIRAKSIGLRLLRKPFGITEILEKIEHIEKTIDPDRKLSDWFLEK